jgi:hypothetical protein
MQAYKHKAIVNESGELVFLEPINITPGEVEVIILQSAQSVDSSTINQTPQPAKRKRIVECSIPVLKEWFEKTEPAPPDFDPDQAKWEYLKEKHNL